MDEPRRGEDPEDVDSHKWIRVGQQVESADEEEGQNVLQVVLVGTPHSLDILIDADLAFGACGILNIGKSLEKGI